ncbi:hypothetical protein EMIHUDRAFT_237304 [Emiliania huxleyi CCMP1516]|uniref:Uncharacterized protein n=2 Tax=Emiliania huxleyi TaxID=2903 RepID=A0A0D3JQX3_EMIH1|nr:hypothetical protein EMIHUDRAFT_237304 [Emiliania huxleyi CCMP1516]EOD25908.1 hypothetical protein EMIHUDRAFT_237304 [Emiliania huxleyi CCMP1516]|eukprot:XP_005778337.1 hypothetical protein EMIHUDRAFT_237304 [Emiliania huxleyi CCMP1516]
MAPSLRHKCKERSDFAVEYTMGDAPFATALGLETSASGMASFASGWGTSASGRYSERVGILEQKLAALESAHAEERAATEKKLAVLEASVAALLHGDGTSAAVPGRCGQATDVDAIASAATALSLDDTVGNHTDDFAERRCGSAL